VACLACRSNPNLKGRQFEPEVILLAVGWYLRLGLEQMVTEILPVGVGALSWITLQLEIRGLERFHNRRQVPALEPQTL
jgi:transposase-like protein